MKKRFLLIIAGIYILVLCAAPLRAQIPNDFKMINATVTAPGELVITASKTSSSHDFDFLAGKWTMDNRRLKGRLNHSTEWVTYTSTSDNYGPMLNGIANIDIYKTSYNTVDHTPYEGLTLRVFNPKTKLWSLYWVDSNLGIVDPPVVGSFEGSVGTFYCKDTFQGKAILVMFQWDKTDPNNPVWAQAFSEDNGKTWEMNMTNVSHRVSN
ncbi:MAG TPA: hypothetical protein VIN08_21625 [Ohtaekwangia sp.]|uniref:hypothetical protein n=1 Tax=Ohtaekwangia sp. TaxID=2066019 RepID=UPI002F930FD6